MKWPADSPTPLGLYGIGIAAGGRLFTLGITLATDACGAVAENGGGATWRQGAALSKEMLSTSQRLVATAEGPSPCTACNRSGLWSDYEGGRGVGGVKRCPVETSVAENFSLESLRIAPESLRSRSSPVPLGLCGIGIAAVGMLSRLGITLATDAYGPIGYSAGAAT